MKISTINQSTIRTGMSAVRALRDSVIAAMLYVLVISSVTAAAETIARLEFRIVGTKLAVSPEIFSVPKGIAGSIRVDLEGSESDNSLLNGTHIEAMLRGPAFEAMRLVGRVNEPLMLPPLNLVGDYQLDNIRLVDGEGKTKMEATPSSIPVKVFDEVLVSKVVSRPLTLAEIQEKGISIDEQNFRAIEFEVGFVLDGKTVPVKFPVIAPSFQSSTEIIPAAELEARLVEAALLNQQLAGEAQLPPELEQSGLNIHIQGINFQRVDVGEGEDLALQIPPIPALMVIPGNIGFLNQFFSVQIFTENAAPGNSGLSVVNVSAELVLPPGPDRLPATEYSFPGDDPLRFARVGPDQEVQPVQPVVRPGADGKIGTPDDIVRLNPGESGQGEFLVEGLQEGLHVMDLELTADLEGLAAGVVKVKGRAAGSVLVRNPRFSMAFSHPRTVRAGEPYEASVTILNTSPTIANEVSVTLPSTAISGGALESAQTVVVGTIKPGETKTATFRIRAQRTGAITFSNLSTSDDRLVGRFRLKMGIDERGVALSPDTIGMPDYVNDLPTNLVTAANRVLGQALSIATAGQLPPGVRAVPKSIVTRRVLELAEAGQRVRYGDPLERVLPDLLLDWQGGREFNGGFDEILRTTGAGSEWRAALMVEIEKLDEAGVAARLHAQKSDLAGRAEPWQMASVGTAGIGIRLLHGTNIVSHENSTIPQALVYAGERGMWLVHRPASDSIVEWHSSNAVSTATLNHLAFDTNGTGRVVSWELAEVPAGSCYTYAASGEGSALVFDLNCDGAADGEVAGAAAAVNELEPQILAVIQDRQVLAGRPSPSCFPAPAQNYGTVLAVLFSKPMVQSTINLPSAYQLDNGNTANSVQIQPGGRVALLNMRWPVGAIRARTMSVSGVTDARGNLIAEESRSVESDLIEGTAVAGRVVRADGSPAAGIPVTLTMYDQQMTGFSDCVEFTVRVSQVLSDESGFFSLDFVLAGVPYSLSATDTGGLTPEAIQLITEASGADSLNREKLLQLASSPSVQNTLLAEFAVGALPEAIAKAEGLDRALIRDFIEPGSPRVGSETPIALRFRGRGTVTGTILGTDGTRLVVNAAVNLFPDPDSRELGRGIYSDSNGRFAFYGVPLGIFSIQATGPGGEMRTISEVIESAGMVKDVNIILSTNRIVRTELRGRVLETDSLSAHPNAQVLVGEFRDGKFQNVVAVVRADGEGFWSATVPTGFYDLVAISFDGKRKGERHDILAAFGAETQLTITLQGRANVIGRVENSIGQPVPNALVAGGETLVRTDANGFFTMPGVPTGVKTVSAGLERNLEAGIKFPRLGSTTLNVLPGIDNFAVIRLRPAASISGRVLDAAGNPVPNVRVVIPQDNGFLWVEADAEGNYLFENLGLGHYELSAPGPAVANTDTSGLISQIRGGSEDEILAAIGEAFAIFTGASDPFLNGEGDNFNPLTWGFTETTLRVDGEVAVADIRFLREGTVSGVVLNPQGVPIGARVRLTGIGPLQNGKPSMVIRAERNSDPALGTFEFPKQLLAGPWGLQTASPFFQVVVTASGQTTSIDPDTTNIVLQFPADREDKGPLTGRVFYPNGTVVTNEVDVHVSLADDYIAGTTNGVFTTIPLFAGHYTVTASDPVSGFTGRSTVRIQAGMTNVADVHLLGKGGTVVTVKLADGTPATSATVTINQSGFPQDEASGLTDLEGNIQFLNLFQGNYAIQASQVIGPTTIHGRSGVTVPLDGQSAVTVFLAPTGKIVGQFVKRDRVTPVEFAQISIGNLGFATTDAEGRFEVEGIPLGSYRLLSQDPVSGIGAVANVTLSLTGEVKDVLLVEQFRGEVNGMVINSYGNGFVPGAQVTLRSHDGISRPRTVTTGPDGRFSFPGTPSGAFDISAEDPVTRFTGTGSGILPENTPSVTLNIPLQPLGNLFVRVLEPDGLTPATSASVSIQGPSASNPDTDENGEVLIKDLRLGSYRIRAFSQVQGQTRSGGETNAIITTAGMTNEAVVVLRGVGAVSGKVFLSDGTTESPGAEVNVEITAPLFNGQRETVLADSDGEFTITNIPVGAYRIVAQSEALAAGINDTISAPGEMDVHQITLGSSGRIIGRLLRSGSAEVVPNIDVLITFQSQSGLPGQSVARSGADGEFAFENVPEGDFALRAVAPEFAGLILTNSAVEGNGVTRDLGDLRFDEEDPYVAGVAPGNTETGVPVTTAIHLYFNEALDETTLENDGIYLRRGTNIVAAEIELIPATNGVPSVVRVTPVDRLLSLERYEIVVIDGERVNATGSIIGSGPTDLVGRSTVIPFISSFTTADNDPPVLLALFPTNTAVQIDTRAVVRLTFNELIQGSGIDFTLTGPGGPVAGELATTLNGFALTFVPQAALAPNASYTVAVNGIRDLAGNVIAAPVEGTFETLDTLGPVISSLAIGEGKQPIAGTTVPFFATLAEGEEGVVVRFTQDLIPVGIATNPPFSAEIRLPNSGTTVLRAIATDRFANDGNIKELVIQTTSNQPPTIQFVRIAPLSGPVPSGGFVSIDVIASDDSGVSELRAIATGALRSERQGTNSTRIRIQGLVPADASPDQKIQIHANAVDDSGLSSGDQIFTIEVSDNTEPVVAILSPGENELLPLETVQLTASTADNSTNVVLSLELTGGGFSFSNSVSLALTPGVALNHAFDMPLADAPTNGVTLAARLTAADEAGNTAVALRHFKLPDLEAPRLLSSSPTNESTGISAYPSLEFEFSESLSNLTAEAIVVTGPEGRVPGSLSVSNENAIAAWRPLAGLSFAAPYTVSSGTGINDLSGNEVSPFTFEFTVTDFVIVEPPGGLQVVETQVIPLKAEGSNTNDIERVRYTVGTSELIALRPFYETNGAVPSLASLEGNLLVIDAEAILVDAASNLTSRLDPLTLTVHSLESDSDEDGVENSFELALGSNPFVIESDTDADGLTNAEEVALGTHPGKPDTDEDGLSDSQEIAAATDPLNPDTDGDGVPDGTDPNPTDASTEPTMVVIGQIETVEGIGTNLLVTVNDADGDLVRLTARNSAGLLGLTGNFYSLPGSLSSLSQVDFGVEPTFTRMVSQIDFTNEPFWPGGPDSFYALKAFGSILIPADGQYRFFTSSDDGSQLFIDGRMIVNNDGLHGVAENSGLVTLASGIHPFEVTFFENGGGAFLRAHWEGPGIAKELIPITAFLNQRLHWEGGTDELDISSTEKVFQFTGNLVFDPMPAGTSIVQIAAIDADLLSVTQEVTVVTLPDLDGDAIPDRDDGDMDGDGLSNDDEIAGTTDPRNPDSDGDSIFDGSDLAPLLANRRPLAGQITGGAALEFDGTNDYVHSSHSSFAIRESLTVAAWFENADTDFVDGQSNYLISKGNFGVTPWNDFMIVYSPDDTVTFLFADEAVAPHSVTSPPLSDGPHHVAGTYDYLAGRLALYIDGIKVAETAVSGRIRHSSEAFIIGDWNGNSTWHFWRGWIDEVQVWNRALSLDEVRSTMGAHLSGSEAGLVAYFPLAENQGVLTLAGTPNRIIASLGQGQEAKMPVWIDQVTETVAAPVFNVSQDSILLLELPGSDAEAAALTAELRSLPSHGKLYLDDGTGQKGAEILSFPTVTDSDRFLIYEPEPGYAGLDGFIYAAFDGQEFSGETAVELIVMPLHDAPIALPDGFSAFQDTPLALDPLFNDSGSTDLVFFTQPANGTVTRGANGTLIYAPDPGFSGTDTFSYSIASDLAWNRQRDWSGGVTHNSTAGNPDDGIFGFRVWSYEYVSGGPLTDPVPWYAAAGIPLTWDASWFGGGALWSKGDEASPPVSSTALTHVLDSSVFAFIPVVTWSSPFDNYRVDLRGNLTVIWSGGGSVGSPVDIDVAIALFDGTNTTPLYTGTVAKPIRSDTINDLFVIPVIIDDVLLQRGHEIRVTLRAHSAMGSRWINLFDDLYILPHSASNTAVATIEVVPNSTPVTSAPTEKSALQFDGSNDYVEIGNPPHLQITGDQTIEFWINLTSYNGRQNPISKAYGGEGTMTIEPDGRINYYYGRAGANSEPYQGFTSARAIPLKVWTHVALVRDLSAGELRWYMNGEPAGMAAAVFEAAVAGSNPWAIGRGYVNHLAGMMDEVRIWSAARSQAEIASAMWQRLEGSEAGLELYFNFDEGTGLVTLDLTSQEITGRLAGNSGATAAPLWVNSIAPFDAAVETFEDTDLLLTLTGTDADGDALVSMLTHPIDFGLLYQVAEGETSGAIIAGASGTALEFDGIDDIVTIAEAEETDVSRSAEWSITAWIKPDNGPRDFPTIYSEGHWGISLGLQRNTGKLESWVNNANHALSTSAVEYGVWSHVAVISSSAERRFYINGEFAGSAASVTANGDDSGAAIGGAPSEITNFRNRFDGIIDEVGVWKKALSDEEIGGLFNSTLEPDGDLAGYWRFDEGSGSVTGDSSPSNALAALGAGAISRQPRWVLSTLPDDSTFRVQLTDSQHRAIYSPQSNFFGTAMLKYRVNDGKVDSREGIVLIRVKPVNDAPVAFPDTNITVEAFPITTVNVLLNDTDIENEALSILNFTQPSNGTVSTNGHGTFLYSPNAGFVGEDSFTYRATDGLSNSLPATVHVLVTPRDEFRWINPAGGLWHIPENWSQGVVPGGSDIAVVDLDGDYTVRITGNGDVRRVVVGADSGTQRLSIESNFRVREESRLHANAVLELRGGALVGSGLIYVAGRFEWTGGHAMESGGIEIEAGATGLISGGGDRYLINGRRLINRGELTLSSTRLLFDNGSEPGARLDNFGTLELVEAAHLIWSNHTSARPVFVTNEGIIIKRGTSAHSTIGVPYSGAGLVDVPEGLLVINQGFALGGTLRAAPEAVVSVQNGHFSVPPEGQLEIEGRLDLAGAATGTINNSPSLPVLRVLGGTWNFGGATTVRNLTLSGGEITGTGTITTEETFLWTGGNMRDAGVFTLAAEAVGEISGGGDRYLINGRVFRNEGTLILSGPKILLDNGTIAGATLQNRGSFRINGGSHILWSNHTSARPVQFVNESSFIKTGAGDSEITVPFVNSGAISIEAGNLRVRQAVSHSGELDIAEGSRFSLAGGAITFSAPATVTGPGYISLEAGTFNPVAALVLPQFVFTGGEIVGTGLIVITNQFIWSGGNMRDAGTFELAETATGVASGGADRYLINGRKLVNKGMFTWQAGRLQLDNVTIGGAILENRGTLVTEDEADIIWSNHTSARPVFVQNYGTWRKTGAPGTTTLVSTPLINEGLIHIEGAVFRLSGGGTLSGVMQIDSGASLVFAGGSSSSSEEAVIIGAGQVIFESGSSDFLHTFDLTGLTTVSGGTWRLNTNVLLTEIHFHGGTLGGVGGLTITSNLNWTGGSMNGAGQTIIDAGATAVLSGGAQKNINNGHKLINRGSMQASGANLLLENGVVAGATFQNEGTAIFQDEIDIVWVSHALARPVFFRNSGRLVKSGAGTTTSTSVHLENSGLIEVQEGGFVLAAGSNQSGQWNIHSTGLLHFQSGNFTLSDLAVEGSGRLLIAAPVNLLSDINFEALQVTFQTPAITGAHVMANTSGGKFVFAQNTSIAGGLDIGGILEVTAANSTLTVAGILDLQSSGTIVNPGTIRVGAFNNMGGQIEGNAPIEVGLPAAFRIESISLSTGVGLRALAAPSVVIHWTGAPGHIFVIETSVDLRAWTSSGSNIEEISPGRFRGSVPQLTTGDLFFRVMAK